MVFKRDDNGGIILTTKGAAAIIGALVLSLITGIGGVLKSSDRFTGTQGATLIQKVSGMERRLERHNDEACHGEVCELLGRLDERINHLERRSASQNYSGNQ